MVWWAEKGVVHKHWHHLPSTCIQLSSTKLAHAVQSRTACLYLSFLIMTNFLLDKAHPWTITAVRWNVTLRTFLTLGFMTRTVLRQSHNNLKSNTHQHSLEQLRVRLLLQHQVGYWHWKWHWGMWETAYWENTYFELLLAVTTSIYQLSKVLCLNFYQDKGLLTNSTQCPMHLSRQLNKIHTVQQRNKMTAEGTFPEQVKQRRIHSVKCQFRKLLDKISLPRSLLIAYCFTQKLAYSEAVHETSVSSADSE